MTPPRPLLGIAIGILAITATACGAGDNPTTAGAGGDARIVEVDMADNAFEPDTIDVAQGETVRFVFTNTGAVAHDAFIGDTAAQADHETEMRAADDDAHGGGHGGSDDEAAITVEPGDTGELTHTFDETGEIQIGCHEPGHYEAGMKIDVTVA